MIERVCSRKYVWPTKVTFHFRILWNRSKWSVIESSALTVPKTSGDHRMDIPGKIDQQENTPYVYGISGRSFITVKIQARGRKGNVYNKWWSTSKRGIEFNILKVTLCELKACNRVNVKRFNILVNYRVQFFIFPQNLKFLNTFLVFLIIPIRLDLPRSGDPIIITKRVKW